MREQRGTRFVSIAAAEQQAARLRQAEPEQVSYDACLEDVQMQLFAQLDELGSDGEALLGCAQPDDFDLVELVNEALDEQQLAAKQRPKPQRARPNKRTAASHECDVCERRFSEPYNLRIHKMMHSDERPHVCVVCGKGFRQLNKLRIHQVTHTKARPHVCDICGKSFGYANYLAVHRRLHTGEKPYTCAVCGSAFHSIHARRAHMKLRHAADLELMAGPTTDLVTSALSYTCPICGRVLTDQCYLNTHLKRHYNQRDFACAHCEKRFFSASELKHHQIAHTRLRPYACAQCGSRFLRKSNYKQHLKIHSR